MLPLFLLFIIFLFFFLIYFLISSIFDNYDGCTYSLVATEIDTILGVNLIDVRVLHVPASLVRLTSTLLIMLMP